jgi:Tol biopolymer transport system component
MIDERERYELAFQQFHMPEPAWDRLVGRRDRKRRNQRIVAGVVGIAVFVAAVWAVTIGGSFNRTQQPAVQPTPTPTPPAGTAPETAYLIDLNTGEMTPLPKSIAGCCYAVSPDGTMVAYGSLDDAGNTQAFIARLDGTDVQQVTQHGASAPFDWSPDGAAIAYTSGYEEDVTNIFVLDLATGETSQVTNEKPTTEKCVGCGWQGAAYPQFSPDGASIVYEVYRGGGVGVDVRIVPVTGGKSVLLVDDAALGTLSPDGSMLIVGCGDRFGGGICIGHADGTNLRKLVSGSANGPKWSPDGTRVAYNDGDDDKIFVVDVATGETTLVAKVSGPAQFGLEWSPDGTRIAYVDADKPIGEAKIFVVDVATGETTFVAEGIAAEWLDDHTLIIEREGG